MTAAGLLRRATDSFTAKVFAYLAVPLVTLSVLFSGISLHFQRSLLTAHLLEEGSMIAEFLAQGVRLGVFAEDPEAVRASLGRAVGHRDILGVFVFSREGALLLGTPAADDPGGPEIPWTEALERVDRERRPVHRELPDRFVFWAPVFGDAVYASEEALYFGRSDALGDRDPVIGHVSVHLSKDGLRRAVRAAVGRNLPIVLLFLAVGGAVTFLVVRAATLPLRRLAGRVRDHGDSVGSKGDPGGLADTFARVVQDLDDAFATNRGLQVGLERAVAARTGELAEANRELSARQAHLEEVNRSLGRALDELKQAQAQLVQSEKMAAVGQLVAGVAHEINNSINFVTGAVPALRRALDAFPGEGGGSPAGDGARADVERLVANIEEGARRASRIVKSLREFSHPGEERPGPCDLHAGLESTLALLRHEHKGRIRVRTEYSPELPRVRCFAGQLNQVFMNLLLNAVQAIPGPGEIVVRTWHDGEGVHVAVEDTGPGIPPEVLPRIFDPFFTTKEVGQGTGLGLAIAYRIVEQHGGTLRAESRAEEGARFVLTLPASNPEAV